MRIVSVVVVAVVSSASSSVTALRSDAFVVRARGARVASFGGASSRCPSLFSVAERDATTSSCSYSAEDESRRVTEHLRASFSGPSREWAEAFGYGPTSPEAGFHALFRAVRETGRLGLGNGAPFLLRGADLVEDLRAVDDEHTLFDGFFTFADMERAMEDDFLDADRGSTDNRKGWKIAAAVSEPKGKSFEAARMTFDDVKIAMEKGTVIFNSIGAHVPRLASSALACTDASSLPCAVNMYLTAPDKRTSAPPHTDKQDVAVVQTEGAKRWRVFSPPDPSYRPDSDPFARGKGRDNLPLHSIVDGKEGGARLLLDVVLGAGDVLFVPAGFPHTTDTVNTDDAPAAHRDRVSVHLTFGLDTHVWDLDGVSLRRFALRRAGVADDALGQRGDADDRYVGAIHALRNKDARDRLLEHLPLGLLDDDDAAEALLETVATDAAALALDVDPATAAAAEDVSPTIWRDTATRLRDQGRAILDTHRDMYLAAIDEGAAREAEQRMNEHLLGPDGRLPMTQDRMQRLSCFRVKKFYDKVNDHMRETQTWKNNSLSSGGGDDASSADDAELPENWEFEWPLKVGDEVEADLGGAFFPGKISNVAGDRFDVVFFDGDQESGLDRTMIKLTKAPVVDSAADETAGLTKKELKKLRKKQEKMERKKNKN